MYDYETFLNDVLALLRMISFSVSNSGVCGVLLDFCLQSFLILAAVCFCCFDLLL
jgi:hypothetical protein